MEQCKVIPEPQQEAIETAGHFYGLVMPDEDLKRRRPIQDFKAGAEWQYRYLAPELEAMRKALEEIVKLYSTDFTDRAHTAMHDIAADLLAQFPSPINTPDGK